MAEQKTVQQQAREQFKVAENAVQQQAREQFKVAENNIQNMARVWNEALLGTTEWSFEVAERSLRYNHELLSQSERTLNEALATYRSLYQDGLKTWEGYVQSISQITSRKQ